MNENIKKALESIAKEECYEIEARGGLDSRDTDEDFIETSVWTLRKMLERAYELGKANS